MAISIKAKCIVWDLDGTLIDSFDMCRDVLSEITAEMGLVMPSREIMLHNYHGRMEALIGGLFPEISDRAIEKILAKFLVLQDPLYAEVEKYLFKDAIGLMQRAHAAGVVQIVVTNREHEARGNGSPRSILGRSPFRGAIDIVVCGDDYEYHKPDSRVLDVALEQAGLKAEELIVIGDQFVDAQLARNLDTSAILRNSNHHEVPHLDRLGDNWEKHVTIVTSLDGVTIE